MSVWRADLHIHSRFSRATSSRLTPRHLAVWSMIKGLQVIGTGDFTHPAWREELGNSLIRDDQSGLYRLRTPLNAEDIAKEASDFTRPEGSEPLFLLQTEISSIYKRGGAVRKVHNLVFMPDLDKVDAFNRKLAAVGNLASDGRPILGLDSEKLLEMVLESGGLLAPAHIWTPWFALFGSKSGFNSLEDCFGSLSKEIFALETGLSSDPDMNRLWSALDRYVMISNSDAHSGENLGREANLFCGEPSYDGIFTALRQAASGRMQALIQEDAQNNVAKKEFEKILESQTESENCAKKEENNLAGLATHAGNCVYQGTVEFFPEEGKYHLDGHRACGLVLDPRIETTPGDICPVCGKPLTVGVLHRVLELADRKEPRYATGELRYASLIPLPEILGEILQVGSKSRKVRLHLVDLVRKFGSELDILQKVPESDLRSQWDALGEAISRMRAGKVLLHGGYDGEYGKVHVFDNKEVADLTSGNLTILPRIASRKTKKADKNSENPEATKTTSSANLSIQNTAKIFTPKETTSPADSFFDSVQPISISDQNSDQKTASFPYTAEQEKAIQAGSQPLLILAGPGTGKTRTLVGRIFHLLHHPDPEKCVPADRMLAVTFTRRAAGELRDRLRLECVATGLPESSMPLTDTLHALALQQWADHPSALLSEEAAQALFAQANADISASKRRSVWQELSLARETLIPIEGELATRAEHYSAIKTKFQAIDYTDLLEHWLAIRQEQDQPFWQAVLVDEIQDCSPLQLALIRSLLPPSGEGFSGIGDPNQAIYGFRGGQQNILETLKSFWSDLHVLTLHENYRSAAEILQSSASLLEIRQEDRQYPMRKAEKSTKLILQHAPNALNEAAWIADQATNLLGSTSHTLIDAKEGQNEAMYSPGDIAILVRLKSLIPPLQVALEKRGLPCAVPENDPFWKEPRVALLLEIAASNMGKPLRIRLDKTALPQDLPASLWEQSPKALLDALEKQFFDPLFKESAAFAELLRTYNEQGSWSALLDWLCLRQEIDLVRSVSEKIQIMTLHAAKGLEFRVVFLPALEDGLMPFAGPLFTTHRQKLEISPLPQKSADHTKLVQTTSQNNAVMPEVLPKIMPEILEEERRLLYVGLTRAKDILFLSYADQRQLYGQTRHLQPSRFLPLIESFFHQHQIVRLKKTTIRQEKLF